jgi:hypothetical protein
MQKNNAFVNLRLSGRPAASGAWQKRRFEPVPALAKKGK